MNPALKTKTGKIKIDIISREHVVNRVSSWPLSSPNRAKDNLYKHKLQRHRKRHQKQAKATKDHNRTTALEQQINHGLIL